MTRHVTPLQPPPARPVVHWSAWRSTPGSFPPASDWSTGTSACVTASCRSWSSRRASRCRGGSGSARSATPGSGASPGPSTRSGAGTATSGGWRPRGAQPPLRQPRHDGRRAGREDGDAHARGLPALRQCPALRVPHAGLARLHDPAHAQGPPGTARRSGHHLHGPARVRPRRSGRGGAPPRGLPGPADRTWADPEDALALQEPLLAAASRLVPTAPAGEPSRVPVALVRALVRRHFRDPDLSPRRSPRRAASP